MNYDRRTGISLWLSVLLVGSTLLPAITTRSVFAESPTAGDASSSDQENETIDFGCDVQPLLSDRCYLCHGPDEASRAADLRLDTFADATDVAIVAGDAENSPLIERILSRDDDDRMPTPAATKNRSPHRKSNGCGAGLTKARNIESTGRSSHP